MDLTLNQLMKSINYHYDSDIDIKLKKRKSYFSQEIQQIIKSKKKLPKLSYVDSLNNIFQYEYCIYQNGKHIITLVDGFKDGLTRKNSLLLKLIINSLHKYEPGRVLKYKI